MADGRLIDDPKRIEAYLDTGSKPDDVHVLPYVGDTYTVDFKDRTALQAVADELNRVVAAAEPLDPWVKEKFGVEGTAEGFVYYPTLSGADWPRKVFSDFAFKAKGEKHKVVRTREVVQIDPEVAAGIDEFVALVVTEPRLEQGLAAVGLDIKKTGAFLKWLNGDVVKETQDELEAAGLEWDDVQKAVGKKARDWYMEKCKQI